MPVFSYQSSIQVNIKPPVTFTITIPYDNIQNAIGLIGQTIQSQTIEGVRWGLYFYVCPQNNSNCSTPQYALSIVFRAQQSGYYLEFDPGPFYISNPPILSFKYPVQNLTSDVTITVTFNGDNISVSGNGQQILTVNMLKSFSIIKQLSSGCWYFTSNNQQVTNIDQNYLSFLVNISTPVNFAQILSQFLPFIILVPVIGIVAKIFPSIAPPEESSSQSKAQEKK